MKCFQSLICPHRNLLLTADSTASGLVESFMTGSYRPIVLKKSIIQNCLTIDHRERHFCTLLREIRAWKPLPKLKISISDAYFSAVETMTDFFNTIG